MMMMMLMMTMMLMMPQSLILRVNNTIHWINRFPSDSVIYFVNSHPLDSDLIVESTSSSTLRTSNNRGQASTEAKRRYS